MKRKASVEQELNQDRLRLLSKTTHIRDVMKIQEVLTETNELALEIATEKSNEGILVLEARESVNLCHATSELCRRMLETSKARTAEAQNGVNKLDTDIENVR